MIMMSYRKVILAIVIGMLFSISIASAKSDTVDVKIANFDVRLNDVLVNNIVNQYPLIIYKDITYFPMTYADTHFLGLKTAWNKAEGLSVSNGGEGGYFPYDLVINDPNKIYHARVVAGPIMVNGKPKQNIKYPYLSFRNVAYFPLTWDNAVTEFGWVYKWSKETGLEIQTKEYADSEKNTVLTMINKFAISKSYTFQSELQSDNHEVERTQGTYTASFNNNGARDSCQFSGDYQLAAALDGRFGILSGWGHGYLCDNVLDGVISINAPNAMYYSANPLVEDSRFIIAGDMRKAVSTVEKGKSETNKEAVYVISFDPNSEWANRTVEVTIETATQVLKKIVIHDKDSYDYGSYSLSFIISKLVEY